MSQINPLYEYGDVKYFRHEHILRMKQIGAEPVKYKSFYERLRRNPSLKEAIYTPNNTNMRRNRHNMEPKRGYKKFKFNLHSLRIRFISFFR